MKKIVVAGFEQETDSFSAVSGSLKFFEIGGIALGDEIIYKSVGAHTAVPGMLSVLKDAGAQIIPAVTMWSPATGPVEAEAVSFFLEKVKAVLEKNKPVDGVFIAFHGATQAAGHDDCEGYLLEAIREIVGDSAVIACSADMHAMITEKMFRNADVICGYQTYPHIDFYETGIRAARFGMKCFEARPAFACVRIPMIVPAESYNTNEGAFAELTSYANGLISAGSILDYSIFQMQPWLDTEYGGTAVVAAAEDWPAAKAKASELAMKLFDIRHEMKIDLYSLDDVIDIALANETDMPVVAVDSADSPNAGAGGDSPAVIRRLLEREVSLKCASVISDPDAVAKAFNTGVGNTAAFSLGGMLDPKFSQPISVDAYVRSLHDGVFVQEGPSGRGNRINIGLTAVLRIGTIDVVVSNHFYGSGDPQLYRAFGIEPTMYDLVVVKSATQYKEAYNKFTSLCYPVDTPGAASAKLTAMPFRKLPRPFYPFDDIDAFEPIALKAHNTDDC